MLDPKIDSVKQLVRERGYGKVLVMLPAGMMARVDELVEAIPDPVFMANPCYGACDVPLHLLEQLKADALFNFGHSRPPAADYPDNVHFFEVQLRQEVPDFLPPFHRVGLVYAVQHREAVDEYRQVLEDAGREVVPGGRPSFMATHRGQVTGCDVAAARAVLDSVDGFVVAADGRFHANAVASLGKPTFNWLGDAADAPKYPVAALFTAESVGIIVGTKPGQGYHKEAREARKKLEEKGKRVLVVAADVLTPEVTNFDVDFWVVAACPRAAEDDYLKPSAPVNEVLRHL